MTGGPQRRPHRRRGRPGRSAMDRDLPHPLHGAGPARRPGPAPGPVILVANHAAFLDGPFVFSLAPRPVNFLVKQEAFTGFFGWLIRASGRSRSTAPSVTARRSATAVAVLERGGAVGIFPEGNRGERRGRAGQPGRRLDRPAHRRADRARRRPRHQGAGRGRRTRGPGRGRTLIVVFGEPFALASDPAVPGPGPPPPGQ